MAPAFAWVGFPNLQFEVGRVSRVAGREILGTGRNGDQTVHFRVEVHKVARLGRRLVADQLPVGTDGSVHENVENGRKLVGANPVRGQRLIQVLPAARMIRRVVENAVIVRSAGRIQNVVQPNPVLSDGEHRIAQVGAELPAGGDPDGPVDLSGLGLGKVLGEIVQFETDKIPDLLSLDVDDAKDLSLPNLKSRPCPGPQQTLLHNGFQSGH